MADTTATTTKPVSRRATKVGQVVSTKMNKTIVVEVKMRKSHALYRRVVQKSRKFYAHDEENTAHVGDFVEIEETRPLSKLKRWRLKNIIQKAKLVAGEEAVKAQIG
jgi:small subunit ribosomal protein S17